MDCLVLVRRSFHSQRQTQSLDGVLYGDGWLCPGLYTLQEMPELVGQGAAWHVIDVRPEAYVNDRMDGTYLLFRPVLEPSICLLDLEPALRTDYREA